MDIFAHGLWTVAGAHGVKKVSKKPFSIGWATFFGVIPDILAFAAVSLWTVFQVVGPGFTLGDVPRPSEVQIAAPHAFLIFELTSFLYSLTHSAPVFLLVFLLVAGFKGRVMWEMLGWGFHILIDVVTHSYAFYPTPVLWPLITWRFNGIPWDHTLFMFVNYSSILIVYLFIFKKQHVRMMRQNYKEIFIKYVGFGRENKELAEEEVLNSR
ncbi:MAG: hypothetical protein AAB652_02075 [Patescibacteria group bacterium]